MNAKSVIAVGFGEDDMIEFDPSLQLSSQFEIVVEEGEKGTRTVVQREGDVCYLIEGAAEDQHAHLYVRVHQARSFRS